MSTETDKDDPGEVSISQKQHVASKQKDMEQSKPKEKVGFVRYDHLGKEYEWVTPDDLAS